MRARYPDQEGYVDRDGVKIHFEVFGTGEPTIFFLPAWAIVHSRIWKAQVPYFARHFRVLTHDPRGNGLSDRPSAPVAYSPEEHTADALAVMNATKTERAVLVSWCEFGPDHPATLIAAEHPHRVTAAVFIAPDLLGVDPDEVAIEAAFATRREAYDGWDKWNRHYWQQDYRKFLEFFFSETFPEPHSTKQIEDAVAWGLETTAETLIATVSGPQVEEGDAVSLVQSITCPVLVIRGDRDRVAPLVHSQGFADTAPCATLVTLEGSGHGPHLRDPVKINLMLRDFIGGATPSSPWVHASARRKRALYISSPIGLGHAQRDIAIADELRKLHPDLEIDWLAQHPVTEVLKARGERIHQASSELANESRHLESESAEHDLHCFQTWRRMDEILVANFMVFHDVIRDENYDLWIGDEAWEIDYFLHENPEQKRAAYVWLTDFVGWLPMPDGGEREQYLTADYNAEMIEQIARFPRVRDRAIFVGDPEDIVPDRFGDALPPIREWTEQHFNFAGYITGFDPAAFEDRARIRADLGYRPDEQVCIVTVGGSGVGGPLLRKIMAAFPEAKRQVPNLRMVVVAGPRIDPQTLPRVEGLEVRRYVHELYRHLAVCDVAIVQGGLTTTMELTANRRPFIYFPLRHHFEQNFHVRHRLNRYRAGRCMDFDEATPEAVASAIAEELGRIVDYRPVETTGAQRAARRIAELL
jgi:pimeloyl-ACP methyl ester carboxylesterase/predicted glycosyltransferase